jgi:hypothetical protein
MDSFLDRILRRKVVVLVDNQILQQMLHILELIFNSLVNCLSSVYFCSFIKSKTCVIGSIFYILLLRL